AVVAVADLLLAAGVAGADPVAAGMADRAAVPPARLCRGRRVRIPACTVHAARANPARTAGKRRTCTIKNPFVLGVAPQARSRRVQNAFFSVFDSAKLRLATPNTN